MKNTKWHYAIVRSMFGDYWIGKTKLPLKKDIIFATLNEAVEKILQLFEDAHFGFDSYADEEDEGYDGDLAMQYEDLENTNEKEVEIIRKSVENFIVK